MHHFSVTAEGGAGALAAALAARAARAGCDCQAVRLVNPMPLNDVERSQFLSLLPDATPHSTGAHLIAAWNWARMKHLFWPWQVQSAAAVRTIDAPAPFRLHAEVLEVIRAGPLFVALWQQALSTDLCTALASFQGSVELTVDDEPERIRLVSQMVDTLKLSSARQQNSGARTWLKS